MVGGCHYYNAIRDTDIGAELCRGLFYCDSVVLIVGHMLKRAPSIYCSSSFAEKRRSLAELQIQGDILLTWRFSADSILKETTKILIRLKALCIIQGSVDCWSRR